MMISFVWSSDYPLKPGVGGSENYTIGHIRELQKRGIEVQVVTTGKLGENDGRAELPDIQFVSAPTLEFIRKLDGIIIFVSEPLAIVTKKLSYAILHCPPFRAIRGKTRQFYVEGAKGKKIITPSKFAAKIWADFLGVSPADLDVVHPFADGTFAEHPASRRPPKNSPVRVLFAGRLTPDKGVYTLFEALHTDILNNNDYTFTATTAGNHTPEGKIIESFLRTHPRINVLPARQRPQDMAKLLAEHDVLVMPSHSELWPEPFGILSVEAQHMGCRVVASNLGGLPETDCGGLHLFKPDSPLALARSIRRAGLLGRLNPLERRQARRKFTLTESVDNLLKVLAKTAVPVKKRLS